MLIRAIILAMLCGAPVSAQVAVESRSTEVSPVRVSLSNVGTLAWSLESKQSQCAWPRDASGGFIQGAGLYIAGRVAHNETVVTRVLPGYDPLTKGSWFTPESPVLLERVGNMERLTADFSDRDTTRYNAGLREEDNSGLPFGVRGTLSISTWADGDSSSLMLWTAVIRNVHPSRTIKDFMLSYVIEPDMVKFTSQQSGYVMIMEWWDSQWRGETIYYHNVESGGGPPSGLPTMYMAVTQGPTHSLYLHKRTRSDFALWQHAGRWGFVTGKTTFYPIACPCLLNASLLVPRDMLPGDSLTLSLVFAFEPDETVQSRGAGVDKILRFRNASVSVEDTWNETGSLIAAFPNPSDGASTLALRASRPIESAVLTDMYGRVIESAIQENVISVSGLAAGVYFVTCQAGMRITTTPVYVRH